MLTIKILTVDNDERKQFENGDCVIIAAFFLQL